MQSHLPSLLVAAAMDQSKLPNDNGSQLLRKGMGCNGPDWLNNNNGCRRMGGGTTRTALRLRKTMRIGGSKTRTSIKRDRVATQQQQQHKQQKGWTTTTRRTLPRGENMHGGPRQGGGIGICQGSALHGRLGWRQQRGVPDHGRGNGCSCNRIVINHHVEGIVVVGSRDNKNHLRIVVATTTPRTTIMTMSWHGSWWGPTMGTMSWHPLSTEVIFGLGLHHFDL
jgi:hypothetical protein